MKTIVKVLAFASVLALTVSCGPKVTGDPETDATTFMELLGEDPAAAEEFLNQCVSKFGDTYFNSETLESIAEKWEEVAETVTEEYSNLVDKVVTGVSNIDTEAIEDAAENLEKNIEAATKDLDKKVEKAAEELEKNIEAATEDLDQKVEDAVSGALKKLGF